MLLEHKKSFQPLLPLGTLMVGLICGFAQAARGQQSDPMQPPPDTMVGGPQGSTGGPSESDVATANNPIAKTRNM